MVSCLVNPQFGQDKSDWRTTTLMAGSLLDGGRIACLSSRLDEDLRCCPVRVELDNGSFAIEIHCDFLDAGNQLE